MSRTRFPLTVITLTLIALALTACPQAAAPPTPTPAPPIATAVPPTLAPPTPTPIPPTATPVPPTPTPVPPTATPIPPTDTPVPPTATPEPPTATATQAKPMAVPKQNINLRGGPGTEYAVAGSAKAGEPLEIVGKNQAGNWLQVLVAGKQAWLSASLVTVQGDTKGVPVPANIPTPPPQPTAAPAAAAPKGGAPSGVLLYSVANMSAMKWELWEYNFATGKARALFDWRTEVAFSTDYKQVAYFAWPPVAGESTGIWVMNRDYTGERLVIRGGEYPCFAPGGARLSAGDGESIYVLNADGGGLRRVGDGEYPAWSPTSNWIAHRACVGGGCGIYLTDPDSGAQQRLTTGGGDGQPAWSPNGKQLAYISKDDGNFEIYRIDVTGANKVRLTNNPTSDGLPIWSPNGAWIAFRSDRGGSWAIYAMRADGSDVRKIVDAAVLPVWFFEKMGWRP